MPTQSGAPHLIGPSSFCEAMSWEYTWQEPVTVSDRNPEHLRTGHCYMPPAFATNQGLRLPVSGLKIVLSSTYKCVYLENRKFNHKGNGLLSGLPTLSAPVVKEPRESSVGRTPFATRTASLTERELQCQKTQRCTTGSRKRFGTALSQKRKLGCGPSLKNTTYVFHTSLHS